MRTPSATLLAQARELYEDAFPAELRADFESLFADEVLVYGTPETASGLVVLRRLGDSEMVFVRYYLAGVRGAGIGSRMWHALRQEVVPARIALDVEHPAEPGIAVEEAAVRRRRVVFYERLGLEVLPLRDYLPPHDDHTQPMQLLATGPTDSQEAMREVLLTVYEHRYGLDPGHPVVTRTLRASGLLAPGSGAAETR